MTSINTILAQIMVLETEIILPMLLLSCLGILLIILALTRLFRGKILLAGIHGISGMATLCIGILLIAISLNIHTYQRLTHEQEIAHLTFRKISPQNYNVTIDFIHRGLQQDYNIKGDEWQLDARILRWSPIVQVMGLDAQYRLERLSGRYKDLNLERSSRRTVYSISNEAGLDIWSLAYQYKKWIPWIDAYYGNAVYLPMVDGGIYSLSVNQSGLVARPVNELSENKILQWN